MRSGSPEAGVVASRIVNRWTVRNIDKQDDHSRQGPPCILAVVGALPLGVRRGRLLS